MVQGVFFAKEVVQELFTDQGLLSKNSTILNNLLPRKENNSRIFQNTLGW